MKEKKELANSSNPTSSAEPPTKKKKQSIACDNCRATKQRCDGNTPCMRCEKKNKTCTYSPTNRGKRKFSELAKSPDCNYYIIPNHQLLSSSIEKKYLDTYFTFMKPSALFYGETYEHLFHNQSTKGRVLQFNIAVASAARSLGDKLVSTNFEKKSRQIASDLFDDFTLDTVRGFIMMSYYYYGQDLFLSQHYRDLAISLCKRIKTINSITNDSIVDSQLSLLKFSAFKISMYDSQDFCPPPQTCEAILIDTNFNADSQLMEFIRKMPFIKDIIRKCYILGKYPCVRTSSITPEEASLYFVKMDSVAAVGIPDPGNFCWSHATILRALVHFCSESYSKAEEIVTSVVTQFMDQKEFIQFCPPYFIYAFHILFCLCFQLGKYDLAHIVTEMQRNLSEVLPLGKAIMDGCLDLLRNKMTDLSANLNFLYSRGATASFPPSPNIISDEMSPSSISSISPSTTDDHQFEFNDLLVHSNNNGIIAHNSSDDDENVNSSTSPPSISLQSSSSGFGSTATSGINRSSGSFNTVSPNLTSSSDFLQSLASGKYFSPDSFSSRTATGSPFNFDLLFDSSLNPFM